MMAVSYMLTWAVLTVILRFSQQCDRMFITEPSVSATSPLTCNIIGKNVRLQCAIQGLQYQITWYFTTDITQAGLSSANQVMDNTNNRRVSSVTNTGSIESTLVLNSFNSAIHSGYYWCQANEVSFSTSGVLNPSRILLIAPPSLPELEACTSSQVDFFAATASERCAIGPIEGILLINITFTNVISITTVPSTTIIREPDTTTMIPEPVTMMETPEDMPTLPPTETTTEVEDLTTLESTGSGGSSTVRTAVIWFAVGAVVLILVVGAVILCAVAIARN